jgi:hypothetical protein
MSRQAATRAAEHVRIPAPVPSVTPLRKFPYISRNQLPSCHVIKSETISAFNQNPRELHRGNES